MKKYFILFLFCTKVCLAQDEDSLTLKDLEVPNTPGFILLDEAPTSIERPNSVKAFTAGIFNSFGQGNGFPKNYAIEFTPFWFFKHSKDMSALKYVGVEKSTVSSSIKTVSLSLAYINKNDTITDKPINNVAFGARFNVFKVYSKKQRDDILDAYSKSVARLIGLDSLLIREGATPALLIQDPAKFNEIQKRVLQQFAEKNSGSPLKTAVEVRPIVALDGALAYNTFFVNNDFSTNRFGRFGAWMTLNFALGLEKVKKDNYFNLYLISRYLSDGTKKNSEGDNEKQNFFDYGGKVEFELEKISFGYEFITRNNKDINTHRSTGLIKYKVQDNLYITGAFGRNFGKKDNLVSILGINWGLSTGNEKLNKE